jgi:glutathione-regulated potassium-efflux system ancillary protein KefC
MNIDQLLFATTAMIVATAVALGVARKLSLGSIVALLVVGVALGPHSPRPLLSHVEQLHAVGELGVTFLLFIIGLDTRPSLLWSMRRLVAGLGSLQFFLTAAAISAVVTLLGLRTWEVAAVVGLGLAMSSDAIALPMLDERGDSSTPQGQVTIAVDIFQTLMAIPVLALIPILGAQRRGAGGLPGWTKAMHVAAAVCGIYLVGRYLLPRALALTARNLGSGAFGLLVLATVLGASLAMSKAGISMALGAFMVGTLLSTTVFAEQIKAVATPPKQVLLGLFFIAIGMEIDVREIALLGGKLFLYLPLFFAIKFAIAFALSWVFGLSARRAMLAGLLLMPFDEIAYVIFASARSNGVLTANSYAIGLAMISFSFAVSPLLINLGHLAASRLPEASASRPADRAFDARAVVVGYGVVGRAICFMLERAGVACVVFDPDLDHVREAEKSKHDVYYGDLSDPALLKTVAIARARVVIVAGGSYENTKKVIENLKRFHPGTRTIAAVHTLRNRDQLRHDGSARVMALLPEGTLSFGREVLGSLGITPAKADGIVHSLQANDYALLRNIGGADEDPHPAATPASHAG